MSSYSRILTSFNSLIHGISSVEDQSRRVCRTLKIRHTTNRSVKSRYILLFKRKEPKDSLKTIKERSFKQFKTVKTTTKS